MPRPRSSSSMIVPLLAAALGAVPPGPAAQAQTVQELQRMVQELQRRINDLELAQQQAMERNRQCTEELRHALERIRELESALAASEAADPARMPPPDGGATAPAADPATGPTSPPATVSNALDNTATLLAAVRARFAADFAGRAEPRESGGDERSVRLWMNQIERWASVINRELRRPIVWTTRVRSYEVSGRSFRLEVVCVDPATQADVGQPFWIQLQSVQAGSWDQALRMGRGDSDFTLRGVLIPQIAVNPTRFEAGPFDQPPFIGTFLEFGFRINVTSFIRVEDRPAPVHRRAAPQGPPLPETPVESGTSAPSAPQGAPATSPTGG